jgi:dienelactone hydrolase
MLKLVSFLVLVTRLMVPAQAAEGQTAAPSAEKLPRLHPLLEPVAKPEAKRLWERKRVELEQAWLKTLGGLAKQKPPLKTRRLSHEDLPGFSREHFEYQVAPGVYTDGYLLTPKDVKGRLPGLVVFHATTEFGARGPAGLEPGYPEDKWQGVHFVRQGYLVWCPRNFINTPGADYAGNAAKVLAQHPGWTGMARMTWDAIRAADFLASCPRVDRKRIGCFGHSLGAKEVLYAMAFDQRYRAGVFSEGGIGLNQSNWDAPWYLGAQIHAPDFALEHHQLLAFIAPRPFLLIAGDSADDQRSELFIKAAKPVYDLEGAGLDLQFHNHHLGHVYNPEVRGMAEEFFKRFLAAGH